MIPVGIFDARRKVGDRMDYEAVVASDVVRTSLITLWSAVAGFLPRFVAAVVVFLVGWLIAVLIGKLAYHIVRVLQVDKALESINFKGAWERSGFKLNSPLFFYELVKWFFVIVFLMAAANILGLVEVSEFLGTVVLYIPNVIVAAVVLLIGILVAKFLEGLVVASVRAAELVSANFLGALTRWSVVIFSLLVALAQLGIAGDIIRIIVVGIVAAVSLAIGLAFGLGGQDSAGAFLANLRKRIKD